MIQSEFEKALRQILKSVVKEVADEILRERQSTENVPQPNQFDQREAFLLSAREAAKRLAISQRTLHKMTAEGLLPCVRVGRLVRYNVESIERWIRASESTDTPEPRPKVVANGLMTQPEKPSGASKSKPKKSRKSTDAKSSELKTTERPTKASVTAHRQSKPGPVEERPNPFKSLLEDIGVDQGELGPLTNGELMRIAEVDLPTFHGWMYLGREPPEVALENLRRHFKKAAFKEPRR